MIPRPRILPSIILALLLSTYMIAAFSPVALHSLRLPTWSQPQHHGSQRFKLLSGPSDKAITGDGLVKNEVNVPHRKPPLERRHFIRQTLEATAILGAATCWGPLSAGSAPPIAIIAEELGYFPVTNSKDETVYVPKRIQRKSSDQAVALARKLRESGAVLYTAYWCPHCARQRELWGREAWKELRNVECAPKGFNAQPGICMAKYVDGYPTMILGNGKRISGEQSLADVAKEVGFKGFRQELETNLPPLLGSAACR